MMKVVITPIVDNPINSEIMHSVIGQMSDGIWENSRRLESVWRGLSIGSQNGYITIEVDNRSELISRTNAGILEYFAAKIKQIIKTEVEDGCADMVWDRQCRVPSTYLNYRQDVQVRDAYQCYDLLKGRTRKFTVPTATAIENVKPNDVLEGLGKVVDIQKVVITNTDYYTVKAASGAPKIYAAGTMVRKYD